MTFLPRAAAVVAAAVALTALAACSPPAPETQAPTDLRLGVPRFLPTHNPINGGFLVPVMTQPAYEALLWLNEETGEYEPWLASGYELSDDRRTLTMDLRHDVTFTDGVVMDGPGMERFWDAMLASPTYVMQSAFAEMGLEVTAIDEDTIEFTSDIAMGVGNFFTPIIYTQIGSPDAVENPDVAFADNTSVGTGPYILDEVVPDVSFTYVRNPDYWNPDIQYYDSVELIIFDDNVAALNALKSGQIDGTAIDLANAAEAEASGLALHRGGGPVNTIVVLDTDGSQIPALGDVRVRQAINLAFDRETIAETIDLGYGTVSSQILRGYPEEVEGGDERYGYDLDRARELMAEAGYADGFDVTIPAVSPTFFEYSTALEPIVQQSLADIGIRVTFEVLPDYGEFYVAVRDGKYAMAVLALNGNNTVPYFDENLYFAPMLDDGSRELVTAINEGTVEESRVASEEFGEFLLDEAWFAPFSRPATMWATIPEIDMTLDSFSPTANVRFWLIRPAE